MSKYYIPELEDLHIGYQCQWSVLENGDFSISDDTRTNIESSNELLQICELGLNIRTKYLNKEDIESKGWEYINKSIDIWFKKEGRFEIGNWTSYKIVLHYGLEDHRLYIDAIDQGTEHSLFEGECKSINELRKIMKYLKIE